MRRRQVARRASFRGNKFRGKNVKAPSCWVGQPGPIHHMNPSPEEGSSRASHRKQSVPLNHNRSRRGKETHISGGRYRNAHIGDGGVAGGADGGVDGICTVGEKNRSGGRFAPVTVASVEESSNIGHGWDDGWRDAVEKQFGVTMAEGNSIEGMPLQRGETKKESAAVDRNQWKGPLEWKQNSQRCRLGRKENGFGRRIVRDD
ncbi:hypothetical protein PIB30_019733 [Stylosanthes scabra]|uniref:Uncharacterized protein n=1 Tax=Stylosanthes scabra TaxID=79078 RepID=A0ABU6W879_9FABA|nr:hypothetical protein [Stylosanthes scabra]